MRRSNYKREANAVRSAVTVSIVIGTFYGATWVLILLLSANVVGTSELNASWMEAMSAKLSIALWFGAIGGGLMGLISGFERSNSSIDNEPWPTILTLAWTSIISTAAIAVSYLLLLPTIVEWITTANLHYIQKGPVGMAVIGISLLLPALGAIMFLTAKN